ncbi:MAG: DinB family protein [Flavobacteriales bacterium]
MKTMMNMFLRELKDEAIGTRKMLAIVPADKLTWKPHERSMSLKDLATHIADLPSWITLSLKTNGIDFAVSPYNPDDCKNADELLNYFEKNLNTAEQDLNAADDAVLQDKWTISNGDITYWETNRHDSIRHTLSQIIHHRAQLGVYLRLLNIPIPGVYGPSADEQM